MAEPPCLNHAEGLRLLRTNLHSDFTICVEDSEFKAHKSVLALKLDYFKNTLKYNWKESEAGRITFRHDPLVVATAIRFIYTGYVDIRQTITLWPTLEPYRHHCWNTGTHQLAVLVGLYKFSGEIFDHSLKARVAEMFLHWDFCAMDLVDQYKRGPNQQNRKPQLDLVIDWVEQALITLEEEHTLRKHVIIRAVKAYYELRRVPALKRSAYDVIKAIRKTDHAAADVAVELLKPSNKLEVNKVDCEESTIAAEWA